MYHEIRTISTIIAKPGLIAVTLDILALPSFDDFDCSKYICVHFLQIADRAHWLPKTWCGLFVRARTPALGSIGI